ncbi:MAG TPA: beta-ketoacyl-[acyl-carrier-protein] synthase family protein [Phaeodactylibacter sp.]|nr:beta-ketoacyl-[acyl-carrier-protein] synthase family protein [Phaeodactylibacter sp.]
MTEKVYVVDYELLSPISFGKQNLFEALQSNQMGESLIEKFDTRGMPFKVGAEIKQELGHLLINENEWIINACRYDRKFELLVACFLLAEDRLQQICKNLAPHRGGVILGVGSDVIRLELLEKELQSLFNLENDAYRELIATQNNHQANINTVWNPYDIHSIYIAEKLKLGAFQESILTACTSSTQAIAFGFDKIKNDKSDLVVCGGTDSIINVLALASFGKLGVIPESDGSDLTSCMPFDVNRKGTLAGEAAGLTVLVSESFARENNLTPIAEIISYGNTLDGYKITAPDPSGLAMQKAMNTALLNAKLTPKDIDYIQAHGTATRHNDEIELKAIEAVFGEASPNVLVSSTKDRHGHAIAAAGIQEFNVLLNSMENDFIPANTHFKNSIQTPLNLVTENIHNHKIKYALTNNFAFGGINTVLLIRRMGE